MSETADLILRTEAKVYQVETDGNRVAVPQEVSFAFREIAAAAKHGDNRDCARGDEPDREVLAGLDQDLIHPTRYPSFPTMFEELDTPDRSR